MTYSGDPEKVAPPLTAASTRYFAIGASPGSTFATIAVTSCGPTRGPSLDWFDVSSHTWKPVTPAPKTVPGPSAKTCLLFSAQGKSKPAIHQLENLQLAMGAKKK
jgi:hypothetical protein